MILLLHGFPTASHMFRDLIPLLADRFRLVAPDLPGFGQTRSPPRGTFEYTFDNLADVIEGFTVAMSLDRYALYIFDYGAPVGLLAVWGRHDPVFLPAGAAAYRRDLPDAQVHLIDAGHFALETHAQEVAALIRTFFTSG